MNEENNQYQIVDNNRNPIAKDDYCGEREYLTLGDIRALDLPDETPIISMTEAGEYLAIKINQVYISQEELDNELDVDSVDEASEEKPILALWFE